MRGFGVTDVAQRRTVNQDSFIIKHTADGRLLLTEGLEESFVFSGQERGIVLETVDQG